MIIIIISTLPAARSSPGFSLAHVGGGLAWVSLHHGFAGLGLRGRKTRSNDQEAPLFHRDLYLCSEKRSIAI